MSFQPMSQEELSALSRDEVWAYRQQLDQEMNRAEGEFYSRDEE